ncbi:hypothetical protein [Heyndrickxia ginsengihumi]|uniref:hypothetical protein n=1 Tax=Heyndrickxia ginsengihumi TaxID=363870 RepID=UPI003D1B9FFB
MGSIEEIIKSFGQINGLNQLKITLYLIIAAVIIFIYKELKASYIREIEIRESSIEKSLSVLSPILSIGYLYRKHYNEKKFYSDKFFELLYSAYPYIEYNLMSQFEDTINNYTLTEEQKILKINSLIKKEIRGGRYRKRSFQTSNLLTENIERFIMRLANFIIPLLESLFLFYLIASFLLIGINDGENIVWRVIRIIALIIFIMQTIVVIDFIRFKKFPLIKTLCLIASTASVSLVLATKHWISILLIFLWIVLLLWSLKNKRK